MNNMLVFTLVTTNANDNQIEGMMNDIYAKTNLLLRNFGNCQRYVLYTLFKIIVYVFWWVLDCAAENKIKKLFVV